MASGVTRDVAKGSSKGERAASRETLTLTGRKMARPVSAGARTGGDADCAPLVAAGAPISAATMRTASRVAHREPRGTRKRREIDTTDAVAVRVGCRVPCLDLTKVCGAVDASAERYFDEQLVRRLVRALSNISPVRWQTIPVCPSRTAMNQWEPSAFHAVTDCCFSSVMPRSWSSGQLAKRPIMLRNSDCFVDTWVSDLPSAYCAPCTRVDRTT